MRKVAFPLLWFVPLLLGCLAFAQTSTSFPRRALDCDERTGILCTEVFDSIG